MYLSARVSGLSGLDLNSMAQQAGDIRSNSMLRISSAGPICIDIIFGLRKKLIIFHIARDIVSFKFLALLVHALVGSLVLT